MPTFKQRAGMGHLWWSELGLAAQFHATGKHRPGRPTLVDGGDGTGYLESQHNLCVRTP